MKKILLFLFSISFITFSQNISPSLESKMSQIKTKEYIPVIIELNEKIDLYQLKVDFEIDKIKIKERASILAKKLQNKYKKSQEELLKKITLYPNDYKDLHQFWAVNMIYLKATPKLIKKLENDILIKSIDIELGSMQIIESKSNPQHELSGGNGTEPGIEAINVRPLWEMGYTGKGTLVFNYDTGVWPTHPAFSNRFFGNFYPMEQCWDGYFSDTPNGFNDHGTHTMGIIGGLISETNDTIGSSFECYWIANDYVTSTVEELPPVVEMVTSFEWSLNPDGDLSTSFDVPDVINNSWRWYNPIDTVQCEGYIVELMNVIETAGIGNIFSAGNDGPNNAGVKAPQRINTNVVNTFCVGSINANAEDLMISTFSTRGPTQCPSEEGSLEIYPEVSAPGQAVRSASGENGFDVKSGTSMAAPHVTGCFLLLKEAFPFLSGEEILLAIYYTAVDLGEEGEDNIYGMGIIDGLAAFNYLAEMYDPVLPNNNFEDISITQISNVPDKISCQNSFEPIIKIKNHGNSIIDGIKISVINNESIINEFIFSEISIGAGEELEINLESIDNYNYGDVELCFIVESLNFINEIDYHNNRRMLRFKHKPIFELPYFENFELGINLDHWNIINSDFSRTWKTIETSGIENSDSSMYVNLYGYNPRDGQKDELISPAINLSGDSINLSFSLSYQKYTNSSKQDTLQVFISTDCGVTFENIIYEKGGDDLSTWEVETENFIPIEEGHWRTESIQLNEFADQKVLLKIVTTNYRGNNIVIDNINLFNENELNIINVSNSKNHIYPNPTNGKINIELNDKSIKSFVIVNSLGQIIIEKKVSNYRIRENLSNQPKGIYYINLLGNEKNQIKQIIIL